MSKWWLLALPFAVIVGLSTACAGLLLVAHANANLHTIQILDRRFDDFELTQGKRLYIQNCAQCHGVNGEGQFPLAPLEPDTTGRLGAPPHNETGHTWHHSDVLLVRYVLEGGHADPTRFYQMPSFGHKLTEEQVLYILAYIKTLWTHDQRMMQRQLTEEEQRLFAEMATVAP